MSDSSDWSFRPRIYHQFAFPIALLRPQRNTALGFDLEQAALISIIALKANIILQLSELFLQLCQHILVILMYFLQPGQLFFVPFKLSGVLACFFHEKFVFFLKFLVLSFKILQGLLLVLGSTVVIFCKMIFFIK